MRNFYRALLLISLLTCPFLNAQEIDDTALVQSFEAIIDATGTLAGTDIHVTSVNAYVLLTGQVLNNEQKQEASHTLAFTAKGIRRLINEIEVVSDYDSSFSEADADLQQRIQEKIEYMARNTQTVVYNGVVHLMGQVSRDEADAAANTISRISGVKSIRLSYEYID